MTSQVLSKVQIITDVQDPAAKAAIASIASEKVLEHSARTDNPHATTKVQVGLGNVDNTADSDKPISAAQQTALDAKANKVPALGDVGSYAFVIKATAGTVAAGATVTGTDLKYSNTANAIGATATAGTWQAMGTITNASASLAIRIA
jgi:hypothetical protein